MTLCLVLHELPAGGAAVMEESVWELSESHWALAGGMLVETSVSCRYLLSHLRTALIRKGMEGPLLVTQVADELHTAGLDEGILAWIQGNLRASAE